MYRYRLIPLKKKGKKKRREKKLKKKKGKNQKISFFLFSAFF